MKKKDLLSIYDLSAKEIEFLLKQSFKLKKSKKLNSTLKGKILGMIFEKNSTRTMVSFASAMLQLGGNPIILNSQNMQRARGETIHDTALTLSSYLDGVMIRAFNHKDVCELAQYSSIPVINGLTDSEHPCQILGDIMTVMELLRIKNVKNLKKVKLVFCGDGSNNIVNSLIAIAAVLGLDFTIVSPKDYFPQADILDKSLKYKNTGAKIKVTENILDAKSADVIYTDVWVSMGFEKEAEARKKALTPYQVNSKLLQNASPRAIVLHCLPAKRGEEITDAIMSQYEHSIFTQAENRLHIQKSILLYLLK
ncbi:MAG: ornithine carbamoyltransferase [Elusimicrobiota bacterium]|jgi:ornithine carbamoyltransferase|nr:ornithine carbamoyltransferase [Elusimicrobiota bacterium]